MSVRTHDRELDPGRFYRSKDLREEQSTRDSSLQVNSLELYRGALAIGSEQSDKCTRRGSRQLTFYQLRDALWRLHGVFVCERTARFAARATVPRSSFPGTFFVGLPTTFPPFYRAFRGNRSSGPPPRPSPRIRAIPRSGGEEFRSTKGSADWPTAQSSPSRQ